MITPKFISGDWVTVIATGDRGLALPHDEQFYLITDPNGERIGPFAADVIRFDGDPPLARNGRPSVIAAFPGLGWPKQPEVGDYVLTVVAGGGWRIRLGLSDIAMGGRPGGPDWWVPTILPAHRAQLQDLIHGNQDRPGEYRVA